MLIGRATELQTIEGLLVRSRLVTLVGPAGVGKTALGVETLAAQLESETMLADLSPVRSPNVADAAIGLLGFPSIDAMAHQLGERPVLVLLDNCEHVLDEAAQLADELRKACPQLRVVATSREPLGSPAEHVVRIEPLDTTGDRPPAVEMFLAELERRGGETVVDVESVTALCSRLDGLPLALQLAASRASAMTIPEILANLDTRLDLLSRRRSRGPDRHQSLRAAIGWSFNLLDEALLLFATHLAVFPAAFTADMAQELLDIEAPLVLDRLADLVDRSLLVHEVRHSASQYYFLDTIHAYAEDQLDVSGKRAELEERLVDLSVAWAADVTRRADVAHPAVPHLLERYYRTMQWSVGHATRHDPDPSRAAAVVGSWWWLEDVGFQAEAANTAESVLRRWPGHELIGPIAGVASGLHRYALRQAASERAAKIAFDDGHPLGRAYAHRSMGQFARTAGRWRDALDHFRQGGDAAREAGKPALALEIDLHHAIGIGRAGNIDRAVAELGRLTEQSGGFPLVHVVAQTFLGWMSLGQDSGSAVAVAQRALEQSDALDYQWGRASNRMALAVAALRKDDHATAARHVSRALREFAAIRDQTGTAVDLVIAAAVFARSGDAEGAEMALASRADFLPGSLGWFEERLFASIGITNPEVPDGLEPVSIARIAERLDAIADEAPSREHRWGMADGVCSITFEGRTVTLPANKGLLDLARLVETPLREWAALDLMDAVVVSGSAGPMLDEQARSVYKARIRDLEDDIATASTMGDSVRAGHLQEEFDRLVEELARAYGLGGRARETSDPAERARSAVTHRIRDAIKRVEALDAPLADHLRASIRTGRFCVYEPDPPVSWTVTR